VNASLNKFIWICLLLTVVVGCRGCNPQTAKPKDPEEEKKKLRITSSEMRTLPFSKDTIGNFHKPGHWYQANHKLKANQQDESLTAKVSIFSRERKLVPTFPGASPMEFQRNIAIGKDQEKNIALKFYQPDIAVNNEEPTSTRVSIQYRFDQRRPGALRFLERSRLHGLAVSKVDHRIENRSTPHD